MESLRPTARAVAWRYFGSNSRGEPLLQDHFLNGLARRNHRQHVFGVRDDDVEDEWAVVVEHFLDGGLELALLVNAPALHSEAFCDLHEVRIESAQVVRAPDVRFVTEDRVAAHAAIEAIFPLNDH